MPHFFLPYFLVVVFVYLSGCSRDPYTPKPLRVVQFDLEQKGEISTDHKAEMVVREYGESVNRTHTGHIKRRGGSSIRYPKHSYELDLSEDAALADLPADDDWILNANYIDKTFVRHVLAYQLFTAMNPNNRAAQCALVELSLNGRYQGLYVLMEKIDRSSLRLGRPDPFTFIFKEPHIFRTAYDDYVKKYPQNHHQQTFPKPATLNQNPALDRLHDFIETSSDVDFERLIREIFDLDNLLDWHLLLLIANNSDGILKNFYLYKANGRTPLRVVPWDYDHGYGRDGDNELNLDTRPMNLERSILFKRLLSHEWYSTKLKRRWERHNRAHLLSTSGLHKHVTALASGIRPYALKNAARWPLDARFYYDDNTFDQEVEIIHQFIELRHKRLDAYFDEDF